MIIEIYGQEAEVGRTSCLEHKGKDLFQFATQDKSVVVTIDLDYKCRNALFGMVGHDVQQDEQEEADKEAAMQLIASTYENIPVEERVF